MLEGVRIPKTVGAHTAELFDDNSQVMVAICQCSLQPATSPLYPVRLLSPPINLVPPAWTAVDQPSV